MNKSVAAEECASLGAPSETFESYVGRKPSWGPLQITRALPVKAKRLVGPWCFLDRYGPLTR
jgi:hypothetical protein